MPFVIDNSIVAGWCFENQADASTDAVLDRLDRDRAVTPALWEIEFVNLLRTACLRRRMTAQSAQAVVARIARLPIDIDRAAVSRSELLALALRHALSGYDAAYLELAVRLQLPIATRDTALRDAALTSGVGVVAG